VVDWLSILKACSRNMKKQVQPLYGSPEAIVGFGRGAGGDVKRKIDIVAEDALFRTLEKHKISCTVISEESGVKQIGSEPSSFYVVADPVDGTTNALRGLPFLDISLAVSAKPMLGDVKIALVADGLRDVIYTAVRGNGAFKNEGKIKPSGTAKLEEAVVGVDLNTFKTGQLVDQLIGVLQKSRHIRHLGANALEICYVADGTTDAFIDIRGKLRVTDMAAGQLILKEAGGIITTPEGDELDAALDAGQRVSFVGAGNKPIHEAIMKNMQINTENS
jgi:myo-inositol-1(or 4)-monophosphatase